LRRVDVETRCVKIKLRSGSLDRVREWAAELNRRADEVLATLRDEGIVVESAFLDSTDEGDFLIYYMKAESLERAREVGRKSAHAVDEYYHQFQRETFESGKQLELLIDFDRIES
jgi:hypothetical protein